MKKFILNSLYFIIPFTLYLFIILIINPYNYRNYKFISANRINEIAESVEPHLYRIISYENNPTKNILLGDSRTNGLAHHINSSEWSNLAYGGGSLKEIIQTFWWAKDIVALDTVVIGINLNLYNKYNKRFWVEETLALKKNFFSYAFSKYTFNATFITVKSFFSKEKINLHKPSRNKEEFWEFQLDETATKFYKQFDYSQEYYNELNKISSFCKENNINLIFWIPPTHIEFQKRKKDFGLEEYDKKFISDLQSLGELYDFDIDSEITRNKEDYGDPMHFGNDVGLKVYKEIFSGEKYYARH